MFLSFFRFPLSFFDIFLLCANQNSFKGRSVLIFRLIKLQALLIKKKSYLFSFSFSFFVMQIRLLLLEIHFTRFGLKTVPNNIFKIYLLFKSCNTFLGFTSFFIFYFLVLNLLCGNWNFRGRKRRYQHVIKHRFSVFWAEIRKRGPCVKVFGDLWLLDVCIFTVVPFFIS